DAETAFRERQRPEPVRDLRQPFRGPEQQEHVARLDLQLAHALAGTLALPGDAEQRHVVMREQPQLRGRAPLDPRAYRYDDLHQAQVLAPRRGLAARLLRPLVTQLQRADELV